MSLSSQPLIEQFGAEVGGVDLVAEISDELLDKLVDALYTYSVLLFRGQDFKPADYARLLHRFGRPKVETRKQFNIRHYPVVSTVGNIEAEDGTPLAFFNRNGVAWHTDGTAACHTNAATFLYAVEVPKQGGDTMYCSTVYAYETMPEEFKQKLDGVRMLCSFHTHNDRIIARDPKSHASLTPDERAALPDGAREAVVLDLETTGLEPNDDVPIEVGLVRFAYDPSGAILGVTDELSALEDPGRPLSPEVARLTGISDTDLAGQRFPDERVAELLDGAVLVIAHNAAFDRPFAEAVFDAACTGAFHGA